MPTIFGIVKMNKKEMREFLESHRIDYAQRGNTVHFRYPLENVLFDLEIHFQKGKVFSAIAESVDDISDGKSWANQCKEACVREGFVAFRDDTNHEYEEHHVSLSKDGEEVYIYVEKRENSSWKARLFLKTQVDVGMKNSSWLEWILYLSGGFLFGLLMFASMGDYSWTSFGIWMLGGLLWGVIFGIIFSLVMWRAPSSGKSKGKGDYKALYEKMQPVSEGKSYQGTFWISRTEFRHRGWQVYKSYLVPTEDGLDVFYLHKKTLQKRQLTFKDVEDALPYGNVAVSEKDGCDVFEFADKTQFAEVKNFVDEKLGYHSEEYEGIFRNVQGIIQEYAPSSLGALRGDKFEMEAEIIARKLYQNGDVQREELIAVITRAFDYDSLYSQDIADLIFEKFYGEVYDG